MNPEPAMRYAAALDFNHPDTAKVAGADLASTATDLVRGVQGGPITDLATLDRAVLDRQTLGLMLKQVEAYFAPIKKLAHDLHKAICAREAEILLPLQRLDRERQTAIRDYKVEQDRVRAQQERELADRERREREERARREAESFQRAGEPEIAAAIVAEAEAAPTPVIVLPDPTAGVDGLQFRRRYLWRYMGSATQIPREFLCVDEKKITAYARSMKGTGTIPGIEFYAVDDPVR